MRKHFIEVPLALPAGSLARLKSAFGWLLFAPAWLLAARLRGAPGIDMHLRISMLVLRLLMTRRAPVMRCAAWLTFPMDSTRYFEFDEIWRSAMARKFTRYLDVSSPRFAPLLLLEALPDATAELINPDADDLRQTRALADAMGLDGRATFHGGVIDRVRHPPDSFDLITCISVLEHIPQDRQAVETMWYLLQPNGRLIITLPCMAQPMEQYISQDQYGVLAPGEDGYTFWQRFYDPQRLQDCIFAVTGAPARMVVYGEKERGAFFRNATMKRLMGVRYPVWREPWMMATEWRYFDSIAELPGDGVVLLEFIKPAAT
jgi:SAM-dependent methyltransferase